MCLQSAEVFDEYNKIAHILVLSVWKVNVLSNVSQASKVDHCYLSELETV